MVLLKRKRRPNSAAVFGGASFTDFAVGFATTGFAFAGFSLGATLGAREPAGGFGSSEAAAGCADAGRVPAAAPTRARTAKAWSNARLEVPITVPHPTPAQRRAALRRAPSAPRGWWLRDPARRAGPGGGTGRRHRRLALPGERVAAPAAACS